MAGYKIWDTVYAKISGLNQKEDIATVDGYVFYLALLFKYTYEIFHNNKRLYGKASEIINESEKYFNTPNSYENSQRKNDYDFFEKSNIDKRKLFDFSKSWHDSHEEISEYYTKYNEILLRLFSFRPNDTFLKLNFFTLKRVKLWLRHPFWLVFYKGYVNIGWINDYEDIFELLERKRNELHNPSYVENIYLYHKKMELFDVYPQFEKDYGFFIEETTDRKPYIVETKCHLIWTSDDGILAKYFKELSGDGDFKCAIIEKTFGIGSMKQKATQPNKKYDEFNEKLKAYRFVQGKQPILLVKR